MVTTAAEALVKSVKIDLEDRFFNSDSINMHAGSTCSHICWKQSSKCVFSSSRIFKESVRLLLYCYNYNCNLCIIVLLLLQVIAMTILHGSVTMGNALTSLHQ